MHTFSNNSTWKNITAFSKEKGCGYKSRGEKSPVMWQRNLWEVTGYKQPLIWLVMHPITWHEAHYKCKILSAYLHLLGRNTTCWPEKQKHCWSWENKKLSKGSQVRQQHDAVSLMQSCQAEAKVKTVLISGLKKMKLLVSVEMKQVLQKRTEHKYTDQ